ncbi:MAG: ABC transporter substrate-binding protein, partial [Clostridia bacterium]
VYHDMVLVGEATGRTSRATRLAATLKRQVRALEARVRTTRSRPAVFCASGDLYTGGRGSFISSLTKLAGGRDVADSMSNEEWPQATAEQVVEAHPDCILVDPSGGTAAAERQIPGFSATTAGKQHHILAVLDSSYLDQPFVGLVRGLQELIAILHPQV